MPTIASGKHSTTKMSHHVPTAELAMNVLQTLNYQLRPRWSFAESACLYNFVLLVRIEQDTLKTATSQFESTNDETNLKICNANGLQFKQSSSLSFSSFQCWSRANWKVGCRFKREGMWKAEFSSWLSSVCMYLFRDYLEL